MEVFAGLVIGAIAIHLWEGLVEFVNGSTWHTFWHKRKIGCTYPGNVVCGIDKCPGCRRYEELDPDELAIREAKKAADDKLLADFEKEIGFRQEVWDQRIWELWRERRWDVK